LTGSSGTTGPYLITIDVIDTPPEFAGKPINSDLTEATVNVN